MIIYYTIRTIIVIILASIATVFYSIRALMSLNKPNVHEIYHKMYKKWSSAMLGILGIKVTVTGYENLKPGEDYVYIANHSSNIDIPIILSAIKDDIRIMYKRELEKIPVFGKALARSAFISVNRSNPREAMKSIEEALRQVREESSVLVFPEGTRTLDGNLQQFKRGAFMIAAKAGKPIVPVAILGSAKCLPAKSFSLRPGQVRVVIGKPWPVEGIEDRAQEKKLMNDLHAQLETMILGNPTNVGR